MGEHATTSEYRTTTARSSLRRTEIAVWMTSVFALALFYVLGFMAFVV